MRRKLAAGNWKMNGTGAALTELSALIAADPAPKSEILICPPAPLIHRAAEIASETCVRIGGQDCHAAHAGAHTGDVSAEMLLDAGAAYVILGHSERRSDYAESDALVRDKTEAAIGAGLTAIVCVGETLDQREGGATLDIIAGQLAGSVPAGITGDTLVIAYEPVWAIGTGLVPSLGQIGEVHDFMREKLEARFGAETGNAIRLLYGGSVKGSNAAEIFSVSNVDGALVGGASLSAQDFLPIISALDAA
ncbi:triose-phosphate isomerase [Pseudodonghicola flavimaris]|uniref:Triosephosphate isomerase n=1 Tax=Pseudodonghicola flavimaris TaxID=3050036 RepID=A0ABT7F543_9RHOB|nr:triose-phosphate isomerase [Pseudodonghicola flavimaris]MDK3019721.1 triose-phosphate isomerase [Pseudodonghicola flavimaris]